jgi:hypothetical protein
MPPPGLLYGTLCVLNSAREITCHAARIRAAQVTLRDIDRHTQYDRSALTKKTKEEIAIERMKEDEEAERAIRRPRRQVPLTSLDEHIPAAPELGHIPDPATRVATPRSLLLPQSSPPEVIPPPPNVDQNRNEAAIAGPESSPQMALTEDVQSPKVTTPSTPSQVCGMFPPVCWILIRFSGRF